MPVVSKAQQRFVFAHQHDPGKLGDFARDFIAKTPKDAYKGLPERVHEGTPDYRARVLSDMMSKR
jgi:hypothetical protein